MIKHILAIIAVLVLCLLFTCTWLFVDFQRKQASPMAIESADVITISPGTNLRAISEEMVSRGWMSRPAYFIAEARLRGLAGSVKSGEYLVPPYMSPREFLELIVSGKVIQKSLTIPEGWNFRQVIAAIHNNPDLVSTIVDTDPAQVMASLGQPGEHPEGRFFPDTYLFPAGTTDMEFLSRAYRQMQQVLDEEWQARIMGLPYDDPYDALIMASLIEKETAVPGERSLIAGVFVRRLQSGMKLQTDPTVIYAMGQEFDGDIRRRDLDIDSPYNTYRYRGLPPTPIAAPGRESIRAALQPDMESNALYFVAMGDGRHYFSETLEEHNRAVSRYQLNRDN